MNPFHKNRWSPYVVGTLLGVYFLHGQGLARLSVKPAILVANVAGGLIFGAGMVLLGLCPGTAVAALGERNRRALAGVLGMGLGAWLQAESYGLIRELVRSVNLGPLTWPALLGVSPWLILAGLAAASVAVFLGLELWARRRAATRPPAATPAAPASHREVMSVNS
jgi:uncharacterized membrane protein YedE/YeeE